MPKFRHGATTVDAEQWTPFLEGSAYSPMPPAPSRLLSLRRGFWDTVFGRPWTWFVNSGGKWHPIRPGDYVIYGRDGDVRLCTPDAFDALYEPVEGN